MNATLRLDLERTERHLRETRQDLVVAIARAAQANDERFSLQDDLRDAQQQLAALDGLQDMGVHIHIDWTAKTFRVEQHYRRPYETFANWQAAVEFVRELRTQIAGIGRETPTDKPQRANGAGD